MKKVIKIYTELDTLLDTRLGVYANISKPIFERVVLNGWDVRDTISGGHLPIEVFNTMYADRLKFGKPKPFLTYIPTVINSLLRTIEAEFDETGLSLVIEVNINTYPYVLSQREAEILIGLLDVRLQGAVLSLMETPNRRYEIINSDYAFVFDGVEVFCSEPLKDYYKTRLTTAAISLTNTPVDPDGIEALRYGLSEFIGLDPIHVGYFSLAKLEKR